jgi:hypothetical protein
MGRGLSELQRYIVAKAATVERLHYAVILADYYGWRPVKRLHSRRSDLSLAYAPGQHFAPEQIGAAQYHRVMVTLGRACWRLHTRGLVTCLVGTKFKWSAVELTPEGRRLAAQWRQAAAGETDPP